MPLPTMTPSVPLRKMTRTLNTVALIGRSKMRTKTLIAVTLTIAGSLASAAYADVLVGGKIEAVYADPSDVVIQLDQNGDCSPFGGPNPSSHFFHIQRAQTNFKELTALMLTALSAGKTVAFFVTSCVADRNIVGHGRANN
jgi:hypothetical protein